MDSPRKAGKISFTFLNPVKSVIARGYYTALLSIIVILIASYLTTIPGARSSLSDQAENNMLTDLPQLAWRQGFAENIFAAAERGSILETELSEIKGEGEIN